MKVTNLFSRLRIKFKHNRLVRFIKFKCIDLRRTVRWLLQPFGYRRTMGFCLLEIEFSRDKYEYRDASNIFMCTLATFFMCDIGSSFKTYKEWALHAEDGSITGGNVTWLEKELDYIILTDQYSQECIPTEVEINIDQFVQLIDTWERIQNNKPQTVIFKHKDNCFFIETKD